jgi:hypothetical protein
VPEHQPVPGLGEQPGLDRLAGRRPQFDHRGTEHGGQFGQGEPVPEYGRHPEQVPGLGRQEVQPPGQHAGQRARHRPVGILPGGPDQLGEVERVPGGAGCPGQQTGLRPRAGDLGHQPGDRGVVERSEGQRHRTARPQAAQQAGQLPVPGDRLVGGGEQQRCLLDRAGEPAEHQQAGRVGPVQVVDQQHRRTGRAPLVHLVQDRLGHHVLLVGGPGQRDPIAAQQGGQLRQLGVRTRAGQAQAGHDGREG